MEKLDVVNAALAALRADETCELVVVAGGVVPARCGRMDDCLCRWQPGGHYRRRQD